MPTYLVERYWPGVTSELLLEALIRGRRVMEEMRIEGTNLCAISCILIPSEEVVFSVYEGPSAAAVRQLNERAGILVSRIVEGITVTEDQGALTSGHQMPGVTAHPGQPSTAIDNPEPVVTVGGGFSRHTNNDRLGEDCNDHNSGR